MWQRLKAKTEMKREHWAKRWNWGSCIKLALRVSLTHGLIAQLVSWLGRLNRIQWSRVQIPLRPPFYSYFEESFSGEYHMYQYISLLTWVPMRRLCFKQMWQLTKTKTEMRHEHWRKRWNWSSCTKLALRVSWTHGLIAQSVRESEQNSVVVGSNPNQANFL